MSTSINRRVAALSAVVALAGLAPPTTAGAASPKHRAEHRATQALVVRGDSTIVDHPCAPGDCHFEYADGTFRGTLGRGAYSGSFDFDPATIHPNGEGGICAPIHGSIVLGVGTPDRVVLALRGESCQDGAGNAANSSFTNVARFKVKGGTGKYANATGGGILSSAEDATDHDRLTLIGRIAH